MAITQTAISYYGLNYVEHAEKDFQEMLDHGCTTVILAVTEFDFDFWRPNIPKIVAKAHEMGLRVLIDPWGNGNTSAGNRSANFCRTMSKTVRFPHSPARNSRMHVSTRTATATTSGTSA